MKTIVKFVLTATVCLLAFQAATAQIFLDLDGIPGEFYSAEEARAAASGFDQLIREVSMVTPDTRERQALKTELLAALQEGKQISTQIMAAAGAMDKAQYQRFQDQLQRLGAKMDRMNTCSPAKCMLECDEAYPGWGKGKGLNRVLCKGACLKINVSLKGAGMGGC